MDFLVHSSVNNYRNPIGLIIYSKQHQFFFARGRKTSLTFLKNKIFTSGQKHRERIGTAVPKHRKTSKTDQNSKSYPKKTEGCAFNSWTQFMILYLPKIAFRTVGKINSSKRGGFSLKIPCSAPSITIFSRKPSHDIVTH